jgi:prepilin signal peptidase PulO-like enzyme (type II secretory pathway)
VGWPAAASLAVLALCLAISVYTDLRARLILDKVTLPALAFELLLAGAIGGRPLLVEALGGMLLCWLPIFVASLIPASVAARFSRRSAEEFDPGAVMMGEGDAKLMAVVGATAGAGGGWTFALGALVWVSIAGGAQGVIAQIWSRLQGNDKPVFVPFCVAIAAGTVLAWTVAWP